MKALSVRQPWAWLLFHGKPIENRDWWTDYRGPLVIHTSGNMTRREYEDAVTFVRSFDARLAGEIPHIESLVRGACIGTVQQIGCVRSHASPFFCGRYGHVYEHPLEFPVPIPAKGTLGLWTWEFPGVRAT